MAYRGGNSMLAGVQSGLQSIQTGLDKRKERKEKQKQEENLLKGVSQMMEHPAVAKYFPEDFDPYEVGAEGTLGAMDMVSRAMEMERLQTQTDQTRLQNQQAERGISENDKFMRQLHQHAQGVGEGVYRPEVRESYRDLFQASPMAAAAGQTGASPEVLQRYGIGAPEEARGFSPEEMGVAREIPGVAGRYFVPTSGTAGQVIDTTEAPTREHNVERLLRLQREAREAGDAEAESVYADVIEKQRGGEIMSERAQEFMAMRDPQLLADLIREQAAARRGRGGQSGGGGRESGGGGRSGGGQEPTTEAEAAEMRSPEQAVDDFFRKEDWE